MPKWDVVHGVRMEWDVEPFRVDGESFEITVTDGAATIGGFIGATGMRLSDLKHGRRSDLWVPLGDKHWRGEVRGQLRMAFQLVPPEAAASAVVPPSHGGAMGHAGPAASGPPRVESVAAGGGHHYHHHPSMPAGPYPGYGAPGMAPAPGRYPPAGYGGYGGPPPGSMAPAGPPMFAPTSPYAPGFVAPGYGGGAPHHHAPGQYPPHPGHHAPSSTATAGRAIYAAAVGGGDAAEQERLLRAAMQRKAVEDEDAALARMLAMQEAGSAAHLDLDGDGIVTWQEVQAGAARRAEQEAADAEYARRLAEGR